MDNKIIIKGAREHNLKNIDLELPRNKFIVFTGLSGSGKSTLAFDTIFAEGQRRYLESLSSYARQFLGKMEKPDVDYIEGLSPAISIDQKSTSHNPRSTVGTVTEIHDYLRLLYAKIGIPHCLECGKEITRLSTEEIVDKVISHGENKKIEILAPVVRKRKGEYLVLLDEMWKRGYTKAYINGEFVKLADYKQANLERYKKHNIDIVVDEVAINDENLSRIFEAVEKALKLTQGLVSIRSVKTENKNSNEIVKQENNQTIVFNQNLFCPDHNIAFPELEPRLFSFNSPQGACETCEGLGTSKEIDPDRVMPDKNRTIAEGAVMPWSYKKNNYQAAVLRAVCNYYHIPDNNRLRDLTENQLNILIYGNIEPDYIEVKYKFKTGSTYSYNIEWKGVIGWLEDRYNKTTSDAVRTDIEKYMSQKKCSACNATRFKPEVLLVTVGGKNIYEVSALSITDTLKFFENLKLIKREEAIAGRILKEVKNRLGFLNNVGLNYLSLFRSAHTLSGGEAQRIRLASQIGSQLVGVLYILDEPSIGLHARDNAKLLETLRSLQKIGNTVIVIEHDAETMLGSDFLVDIGHGAGKHGGEIVASGSVKDVLKNEKSLTVKYLTGKEKIETPKFRRPTRNKNWLIVRGASEHNLKSITVEFPLKVFTCVTGVSGSGKSTLVEDTLYKALANKIHRALDVPARHKEIVGINNVRKVIMVDQSPIGKTPRSNPATYTKLFTPIRELFAKTKDAKVLGFNASRFSFNVRGGRCDNCDGAGLLKIEMQFMPDVFLPCDVCSGARYNSQTLKVRYKGKTIADVLKMTVSEAKDFFANYPDIYDKLKVLEDVGLGYIELGQSATTLSGGEAQRIKLSSELARRSHGSAVYILDEPTTGLHFEDIKKLLDVINRLVDAGNSVIMIEHNMDVIKTADWIIDMGPEGGENGGRILISGTPEEVARNQEVSHTGKYLTKIL